MKIYDISQEVFGCNVYPGDKRPAKSEDMRMSRGDMYNLTSFEMCAHNGTHIDAPFHFIADGKTVEQISLDKVVGLAFVTDCNDNISAEKALEIINAAKKYSEKAAKRILIKGDAVVSLEAAEVFAENDIFLLGVESQSVGPETAPARVHRLLLSKEVVLLEGLLLSHINPGVYMLNAAPLSLAGSDGAPCRAILIDVEK